VNLAIPSAGFIGLLGQRGGQEYTAADDHRPVPARRGRVTTFGTVARDPGPAANWPGSATLHQEGELLNWMTVGQLIRYVSAYYPNWNAELERRYLIDFEIQLGARVGSLSPGERQKVAILIAIGFEPES